MSSVAFPTMTLGQLKRFPASVSLTRQYWSVVSGAESAVLMSPYRKSGRLFVALLDKLALVRLEDGSQRAIRDEPLLGVVYVASVALAFRLGRGMSPEYMGALPAIVAC